MLNLFQHLTASLYLPPPFLGEILKQVIRLRSSKISFIFLCGMARMTLGGTCNLYSHFGQPNSIFYAKKIVTLLSKNKQNTFIMKQKTSFALSAFVAALLMFSCSDPKRDAIGKTEVVIETSRGDITLRLYDDTPLHRDNFIKMINEGVYEDIIWNRIVPEGTIQSGEPTQKAGGAAPTVDADKYRHTIPAEIKYPKYYHKAGALAMARRQRQREARKQWHTLLHRFRKKVQPRFSGRVVAIKKRHGACVQTAGTERAAEADLYHKRRLSASGRRLYHLW